MSQNEYSISVYVNAQAHSVNKHSTFYLFFIYLNKVELKLYTFTSQLPAIEKHINKFTNNI